MAFYSWDDLNRAGNDFGSQVARQAKSFGCSLWNRYPKNFISSTPGTNALRGFWNTVCAEPPTNQPPTLPPPPPFTGGQCCNKRYRIFMDLKIKRCYQNAQIYDDMPQIVQQGKVLGIYLINAPPGFNANGIYLLFEDCSGNKFYRSVWSTTAPIASGACLVGSRFDPIANYLDPVASEYKITSIVTLDGSPDNCGDPETDFPDTPDPNPGDENTNITINVEGDEANNFSFPLIWNEIDFKVPLHFDFEVGKIDFNFDGININLNGGNSWHIEGGDDTGGDITNDINNIFNGGGVTLNLNGKDSEEGEETEDETKKPLGLVAVKIDIVRPPKKGKTILMNNSDDNTYFAGYFSWLLDGSRSEEFAIRKSHHIFVRPSWAEGYRVYSVNGASLKTTIYTQP